MDLIQGEGLYPERRPPFEMLLQPGHLSAGGELDPGCTVIAIAELTGEPIYLTMDDVGPPIRVRVTRAGRGFLLREDCR